MDSNERKAFGERVAAERNARHLTQRQLGERVGASAGTISNTERGLSFPQARRLTRLLEELEISMNGHDEPSEQDEPTTEKTWGDWFESLPKDSRSLLYMMGLYLERLGPDERDERIRQITIEIVEQRL